jgi:hypothetical protein
MPLPLLLPSIVAAAVELAGITAWETSTRNGWTSIWANVGVDAKCHQTIQEGAGPPFETTDNAVCTPTGEFFALEETRSDSTVSAIYDAVNGTLIRPRRSLKPKVAGDNDFFALSFDVQSNDFVALVFDYPDMGDAAAFWIRANDGSVALAVDGLREVAFREFALEMGAYAFDATARCLYHVLEPRNYTKYPTLHLLRVDLEANASSVIATEVRAGEWFGSTTFDPVDRRIIVIERNSHRVC